MSTNILPTWAQASLFRRFTDTNVYGTGSVKMLKTRRKEEEEEEEFIFHKQNS